MVNQMIADDDDVQNMSNIIDFEDNQAAENYKAMLYWTHFDVKHFRDFKNHTNNILTSISRADELHNISLLIRALKICIE